jgi:hypothetical protein
MEAILLALALPTDIVSLQAICHWRLFFPNCLLARTKQNWNFGPGAHIALKDKEKLATRHDSNA